MPRPPRPLSALDHRDMDEVAHLLEVEEGPILIKHFPQRGIFYKRLKIKIPQAYNAEIFLLMDRIRPRPIVDNEVYRRFWATPKTYGEGIINACIPEFGKIDIILPYRKTAEEDCHHKCALAESHFLSCECKCAGVNHRAGLQILPQYRHQLITRWEIDEDSGYAHVRLEAE